MDSKRLRKLKSQIISTIPFFPNNREIKTSLESKHLTDLLITYLGWKIRHITPRKRQVFELIESLYDPNNIIESTDYLELKTKIENGEDLTPYLSLKAQRKGYTPASGQPEGDQWSDKDFFLNVMSFHHLHLKAFPDRTDDVVFARVTRAEFAVIGFFNHDVFDSPEQVRDSLNPEREKLWNLFDKYSIQNATPNSVVIPSMISLSGHTVQIMMLAKEYVRIIEEIDPKLDDREYVNSLYDETDISPPNKLKLEWYIRGTDIGIYDKESDMFMVLRYGVN